MCIFCNSIVFILIVFTPSCVPPHWITIFLFCFNNMFCKFKISIQHAPVTITHTNVLDTVFAHPFYFFFATFDIKQCKFVPIVFAYVTETAMVRTPTQTFPSDLKHCVFRILCHNRFVKSF